MFTCTFTGRYGTSGWRSFNGCSRGDGNEGKSNSSSFPEMFASHRLPASKCKFFFLFNSLDYFLGVKLIITFNWFSNDIII